MSGKPRILVADDDEEVVSLLTFFLQERGYEVLSASNGEHALAIAGVEELDLVLLDIMMPGMDGYQVAHQLSQLLGRDGPRVLIVTGRTLDAEKAIAGLSGATAVFQKPIKLEELDAKIKEILAAQSDRGGARGAR